MMRNDPIKHVFIWPVIRPGRAIAMQRVANFLWEEPKCITSHRLESANGSIGEHEPTIHQKIVIKSEENALRGSKRRFDVAASGHHPTFRDPGRFSKRAGLRATSCM
jgi:hypothetical protein